MEAKWRLPAWPPWGVGKHTQEESCHFTGGTAHTLHLRPLSLGCEKRQGGIWHSGCRAPRDRVSAGAQPLPGWVAFFLLLFCLTQGPGRPELGEQRGQGAEGGGRGAPPGGPKEVKGERRRGKEVLESAGGRGR